MEKWQNQSESLINEEIRQSVGRMQLPVESYSEQIMNRIEYAEATIPPRGRLLRKTIAAAGAAVILGVCTLAAGFISPAWAETLRQLPVLGSIFEYSEDPGLMLAAKNGMATAPGLSVTHDGVTLSVTDVFYDGTRLDIGFERSGITDERVLAQITNVATHDFDQSTKGLLGIPRVTLPSGEAVEFGSSVTGDVEGRPNTLLLELNNPKNTASYGEEFKVHISVPVAQVAEPFEFVTTVKKASDGNINLTLNQGASRGSFSYKVTNLDITPATIRLVIDSKGEVPIAPEQTGDFAPTIVFYEIVDEEGQIISPKQMGYPNGRISPVAAHVDNLYNTFPQVPKTITVRPYTCTFDKDMNLLMDANGERLKTYYKDLETTIVIP
jgi:hypothetical protein